MSADTLVPKIRFKGFDDEWKKVKLYEVCKVQDGTHFTPNYTEEGIPFYSVETIVNNVSPKYISQEDHEKLIKRCHPKKGDILMSRITAGILGFPKFIDWDYDFSIYVSLALLSKIKINSKYLNYYIQSPVYRKDFLSKSLLIASPPKINLSDLESTSIKYPKRDEQEKIANFFGLVDKKTRLLKNKLQLYQNFKKYLMQQIFTQKLRFNFKGEWEESYVNEIFDVTRGEVIAKRLIRDIPSEEYCYPVFSSQTTNKGVMGYFNDFDFDGEYITWTTDGANAGKTVYRNGKFKCSNVCGVLKAKTEYTGFANPFIAEYLDSITYRYVSYVGNPKLMNNVMSKIKIKYPPLDEQQKISKLFECVDYSVDLIQNQIESLENFKKGLLQKMFV